MPLVRRTVLVDPDKISAVPEGMFNDMVRKTLDDYCDPDNADKHHAFAMDILEKRLKVFEEELKYIEIRKPLLLEAIERTKRLIKDDQERFEFKRQTIILQSYMRPLCEFIIATDYNVERTRIECAHMIDRIVEINPHFQLEPWVKSLKREME